MNKLLIICGLSFAGKSTLAQSLVERLGYEEVDVDRVKCALYGVDIRDDLLTRAQWNHLYQETDQHIIALLTSGNNVIDASRHFTRAERDHIRSLVGTLGYEAITIYVTTSEAVARQRWQANRQNPSRRDVTDADFEASIRAMEPPSVHEHPLLFHSGDSVDRWLTNNLQKLT